MRPIAIFRHSRTEGPGYFAIFLERHGIPWRLIGVDSGEAIPGDPREFAGLCFMGGPMSVNDPLPWIGDALALIRLATSAGIPVIGHCLGGQLMSRALGGQVCANPKREIGWWPVQAEKNETAARWLGSIETAPAFHWHGETFSLPPGAVPLLSSAHCANQAFALGPHLALQCHLEMLPEMIRCWCKGWERENALAAESQPGIQTPAQMLSAMESQLPGMRRLADRLYEQWITGLPR